MNIGSVAGFDVLFPSGAYGAASSAAAQPNPYRQSYDQLATWSNAFLLQSAESGPAAIAPYMGGQSVGAFAGLTNLLAAIAPGVQSGLYGGGTGQNVNTFA